MKNTDVVIVGGGFTGLAAAYELTKNGYKTQVIEMEREPGGLAGTFEFKDGVKLEKFYHHWFNNDLYVPKLVKELGMEENIITLPTKTGMYFNGRIWKLSTPLDVLKFKALSFSDRIRLGLLVFKVRQIKDWKSIEHLNIREWLEPLCGKTVFKVIWEPLIQSKFSIYAESVNAVWMWKKLVLRGSTRNERGGEELAYFKGGFGKLANALVDFIEKNGGEVKLGEKVIGANIDGNKVKSLKTLNGEIHAKQFLLTPSFPIIADIFKDEKNVEWIKKLQGVKYLGNICLVLRLKKSLSDTYWLNVNDPGFPFVGVIEHTNFDKPENYKDSHIVYLSRYLATEDPIWKYNDSEYLNYSIKHLKRMFLDFESSWIIESKVWRENYAQPIVEKNYSKYLPNNETPYINASIATMAQIYPEDRGTNYAIRDGRKIASLIINYLSRTN
jgi:protoporphyrinogen oxidase